MSNRHYYTDPRHALDALLDHRIETTWGLPGSGGCIKQTERSLRSDVCFQTGIDGYYYIHPDSLHLLEPREGDFCLCKTKHGRAIVKEYQFSAFGCMVMRGNYDVSKDRFLGIIQRNGIAFHWPEVEDDQ